MTMVSTGEISLGGNATSGGLNRSVNIELGRAATATINMNESAVRTLAGVPSGAISMSNFYGKSNRAAVSFTYSTSTANASLNLSTLSGYVAGVSDITVTVNSGVYLWASSTGSYALNLTGATTGDTVTLVNNGFIMGCGGQGGGGGGISGLAPGSPGGPAINLGIGISSITINNTNASAYIGGGGGGGGGQNYSVAGGGGGAGGGSATTQYSPGFVGGGGGSIGNRGGTGPTYNDPKNLGNFSVGGGGGRIFGGSNVSGGQGGFGGGGGGWVDNNPGGGGIGNGSNGSGGNATTGRSYGGGGGGYGASGGLGWNFPDSWPGGSGGKAVNTNGKSITWVSGNTTRVYGAVS